MIDRKIDLTENQDFSSRSVVTLIGVEYDDEWLTPDEYEANLRWINLFGKRKHQNEKSTLFDNSNSRKNNGICNKCGKRIRSPWNNLRGRCRECFNSPMDDERIPWKAQFTSVRANDDYGWSLFRLR